MSISVEASALIAEERPALPPRFPVTGVPVSATDYAEVVRCVLDAARRGAPCLVTALAVRGFVEARSKPRVAQALARFDIMTPDGQPVRFALNLVHRAGLSDRVYGPTLMFRLCERAAREGPRRRNGCRITHSNGSSACCKSRDGCFEDAP